MKEIIITIFVLSLQEEYDVSLPIKLQMNEAIDLIQDTIVNLSSSNYEKKNNVLLYTENGKVINTNNTVKYSGLQNGIKVLMK